MDRFQFARILFDSNENITDKILFLFFLFIPFFFNKKHAVVSA